MEANDYCSSKCLQDRMKQSLQVKYKYPDRIPVFLSRKDDKCIPISKNKFLVPKTMTFGELLYILRRHIELDPKKAMIVFLQDKNILPPCSSSMQQLFSDYMSNDGFLYMVYSQENTFGSLSKHYIT